MESVDVIASSHSIGLADSFPGDSGIRYTMGMIRVMLLVLLLVPAWSFAQENEETKEPTLAELARQERERRAQLKEVLVITNANLKRVGGGFVSTATGPEATEGEEGGEAEENNSEKAETDHLRNENLSGNGTNQARIQERLLETQQEIDKNAKNAHSARQALDALEGEFQKGLAR